MGSGGVGGYFGARLARAGGAVTFVARGAHLDAIRRHGLRIRSAIEGEYAVKAEAVERLDGRPVADVALLCVKSFDTESALAALRPAVGPGTAVLSLQNGVDNVEKIDTGLGPGHALGGAAYVFAAIEAPGVIAHRFAGRIVFGELDGRITPRCERLREAFAEAGTPSSCRRRSGACCGRSTSSSARRRRSPRPRAVRPAWYAPSRRPGGSIERSSRSWRRWPRPPGSSSRPIPWRPS